MERGTQFLKGKINPTDQPVQINEKLYSSVKVASSLSPYCVKLSKVLVSGMVMLAEQIGNRVSGSFSKRFPQSKIDSPHGEAIKCLGESSLNAVLSIWDSLEIAGRKLVGQTRTSTVEVIDYKYGKDAGSLAQEIGTVAVDAVETFSTVKQLGLKKFAKRTAKEAGKQTTMKLISSEKNQMLLKDDKEQSSKLLIETCK